MKKLFGKFLKQSLVVLGIITIIIICSSIFGSISNISKLINESKNAAEQISSQISTEGEVEDVEGYANIVYALGSGTLVFSTIFLYIIKVLMQIIPILLFISVTFSNLIAWLFNLGETAKWKRNTGLVFWSINLVKLLAILIMAIFLIISSEFNMPFLSYGVCIAIISSASIIYQAIIMTKNKNVLKLNID